MFAPLVMVLSNWVRFQVLINVHELNFKILCLFMKFRIVSSSCLNRIELSRNSILAFLSSVL